MRLSRFISVLIAVVCAMLAASHAATCPAENRILFVANSGGSWQIYSVKPDGTDTQRLTNLAPTDFALWWPSYSPDGTKIAFAYGPNSDGGNDVFVMNCDGSELTQVTQNGLSEAPRWSHDGKRIAYARISNRTFVGVIFTMNADGTDQQRLTGDAWDSYGPFYTSDDKNIVFYSQKGGFVTTTWIMNPDGTGQRRLTGAALEAFPYDISPKSHRISLISHENTSLPNAILDMKPNGSDLTFLTHVKNAHDLYPSYSPDGNQIVFASDRMSSDNSLDLFVMDANGSNVHRIATGLTLGGCPDGNCVTPSWGPKP
jgi:Tol biopolymer transport system component